MSFFCWWQTIFQIFRTVSLKSSTPVLPQSWAMAMVSRLEMNVYITKSINYKMHSSASCPTGEKTHTINIPTTCWTLRGEVIRQFYLTLHNTVALKQNHRLCVPPIDQVKITQQLIPVYAYVVSGATVRATASLDSSNHQSVGIFRARACRDLQLFFECQLFRPKWSHFSLAEHGPKLTKHTCRKISSSTRMTWNPGDYFLKALWKSDKLTFPTPPWPFDQFATNFASSICGQNFSKSVTYVTPGGMVHSNALP